MSKLTTFDVTGTLLRFKRSVGQQYSETLQKAANITCDSSTIDKSFSQAYVDHSKIYPVFGYSEAISIKSWWRSVFYQTLLISGVTSIPNNGILSKVVTDSIKPLEKPPSFNAGIENAFETVYNSFEYEPMPHALDLLKFVKSSPSNVTGVITNSDDRVLNELQKAGKFNLLDRCSTDLTFSVLF